MEVQTIQVGPEAIVVPPGAMIIQRAVGRALVVVAIFGGKWKTTMITEGITSSSWKKENAHKANFNLP